MPARSRTTRQFLLDETTAIFILWSRSVCTSATVESKTCAPVSARHSRKAAFFRFPSPHTVSRVTSSSGSPSGSTMPRAARKLRTPS